MIPNHWYAILASNEVKVGKPVGVTRLGEKLVLWRDSKGQVACMSDLCPHRGVALSIGRLVGDCVECPFHGFQYDSSGRCTVIPANGKNALVPKAFQVKHVYPTREAHDFIYIWWGEPRQTYPPLPWFESVDDTLSCVEVRDHWPTHYSRAIENQLDVVHVPFVHHNTIGRGNQTLVNGPLWTLERREAQHDLLSIWYDNAVDTGQRPLKPSEMPAPNRRPLLQFHFPNVWHNWLGDKLHIIIAFAPIDDENTQMYVRQYQGIVRAPVLRELFNGISYWGNRIILNQDKRPVTTERPKRTSLHISEKLIPGDGPIVEYRRRRQELIEKS
jgi:phenylpropionate dioxygenase-like ring-hydroxylating dioxygenase large terminal subunit